MPLLWLLMSAPAAAAQALQTLAAPSSLPPCPRRNAGGTLRYTAVHCGTLRYTAHPPGSGWD